jgi:hypothetical protein
LLTAFKSAKALKKTAGDLDWDPAAQVSERQSYLYQSLWRLLFLFSRPSAEAVSRAKKTIDRNADQVYIEDCHPFRHDVLSARVRFSVLPRISFERRLIG